jgi:cation:H+ antiporter
VPAWLIFIASGAAVVFAGTRLARSGDVIAERTGMGRTWVGAILVAAATSLPELTTDSFAVLQGHPDLAVGDLFGSSMTNMLILALADIALTRVRVLTRVAINQAIVGTLGITLMAVAIAGVLTEPGLSIISIGWAPLMIGFSYVAGMRLIYLNREGPPFTTMVEAEQAEKAAPKLSRAAFEFGVATIIILIAARFLASSAADLADQMGLATGFFGIALLALTTSLPEVAVTVASLRAGYDLAVGNLLGSNVFNMVIIIPLDLIYRSGPILGAADRTVMVGALFAIFLTALTILEVLNRSERRVWYLEPDAIFRILVYMLGLYLAFRVSP